MILLCWTGVISDLHEIFIQTTEPIRSGRQFPRKHKVSRRKYFQNYKPIVDYQTELTDIS